MRGGGARQIASLVVWVRLASTVARVLFGRFSARMSRGQGAAFVAAYVVYVGWLLMMA